MWQRCFWGFFWRGFRAVLGQEHGDFREIITRAKSEVFPALIFVKPIVEDYGSGEKKQQEVFGSGVIISPDGYAVTNWHVVDKAVTINCVLYDKQQVRAEFIGSDRDTDLALLKLPAREGGQAYPCASGRLGRGPGRRFRHGFGKSVRISAVHQFGDRFKRAAIYRLHDRIQV